MEMETHSYMCDRYDLYELAARSLSGKMCSDIRISRKSGNKIKSTSIVHLQTHTCIQPIFRFRVACINL